MEFVLYIKNEIGNNGSHNFSAHLSSLITMGLWQLSEDFIMKWTLKQDHYV